MRVHSLPLLLAATSSASAALITRTFTAPAVTVPYTYSTTVSTQTVAITIGGPPPNVGQSSAANLQNTKAVSASQATTSSASQATPTTLASSTLSSTPATSPSSTPGIVSSSTPAGIVSSSTPGTSSTPVGTSSTPVVTSSTAPGTSSTSSSSSSSSTASSTPSGGATNIYDDYQFNSDILSEHNVKRALHGVPNVGWSDTLATYAHDYANRTFSCDNVQLIHSGGPYGENLAAGYPGGISPVDAWYDEIQYYNYSNPGFSEQTGHFTQVVWKSTTTIGCARVICDNEWQQYTICEYSPAGNVVSGGSNPGIYFQQNVLPLVN